MQKGLKKIGLGLVAVGLSITLLLMGAIPVCQAEPVGEKVVRVGHMAIYTGPAATTYWPAIKGLLDYVRYINEEQEGINGVRIAWEWQDSRGEIPRSILAYKRIAPKGVVTIVHGGASECEACVPLHVRDKIPVINSVGLTKEMITQPIRWVFGFDPGLGPMAATFMKWVKDNWTETRPPRLGVILFDESGGWKSLWEGVEEYYDGLGFEYVGYEVVGILPPTIDTTTEWLRLAGKKPDWVYIPACGAALTVLLKDAQRLNIRDTGMKMCTYEAGLSATEKSYREIAGEEAIEGWYTIQSWPATKEAADTPKGKLCHEVHREYRGKEELQSGYHLGWLHGVFLVEAIRLGLEEVGHENLNGVAFRDALLSIKDFDSGLMPPVTVTEKRPYWSHRFKVYQVREGELWPASEWLDTAFHYPELG